MNKKEIWKDIAEYEGLYQASNLGRICSLPRNGTQTNKIRNLQLGIDGYGYLSLGLSKNNIIKTRKAHRLVAQTFIPNPNNFEIVNHIDGDKLNNHVENLEWCDRSRNAIHGWRNKKKLSKEQVIEMKTMYDNGVSQPKIAKKFGISQSYTSLIVNDKKQTYV